MWQTSRFELKYMIPAHQLDDVRRWIRMFIQPDRFAASCPDFTYTIGSLYLDSADLRLYRMTAAGLKNRFKLRIRAYCDDPAAPVFLEIKRRIDRVIRKSRVKLGRAAARQVLEGSKFPREIAAGEDGHHLENFLDLMHGIAAGPIARIRYEREAYESPANDLVRLTLDRALAYAVTPDFELSLSNGCWHAVPMQGTLLEIKVTDNYPQWVAEMIRRFELRKIPFSKYNLSVDRMTSPLEHARELLQGARR